MMESPSAEVVRVLANGGDKRVEAVTAELRLVVKNSAKATLSSHYLITLNSLYFYIIWG